MVNESVNTEIVEAAQVEPGDLVLEIGPGTGSLTKALVEAGAHVIAIEKDADMASLVSERFQGSGQVKVVQVDFLKWPVTSEMRKLMQQDSVDSKQPKLAKVVSNLPFNITTSVIKRLLPMGDIFSRVVLLLQDTIEDYNPMANRGQGAGTGWTFSPLTKEAMMGALWAAIGTYRHHHVEWAGLMHRGMSQDYSWDKAALQYEQVFEWAMLDPPYA